MLGKGGKEVMESGAIKLWQWQPCLLSWRRPGRAGRARSPGNEQCMPPSPISSSLNCSLHPDSACILLASLHPVDVSPVNPGLISPPHILLSSHASSLLHAFQGSIIVSIHASITLPLLGFPFSAFHSLGLIFALFSWCCPFYSLHASISLPCGLFASPFSVPPFLLDIHPTPPWDYVLCVCAVLPNYWLYVCTDAAFPAYFDLPKTPRAFSVSVWLTELTTLLNPTVAV